MEDKPNRYVVIPARVLFDKRLSDKQKILLGVINNLSSWKGYCFASNEYLSRAIGCSIRTLQREIDMLVRAGYILREIERNEAGGEKRLLHVLDQPPMTSMTPPRVNDDTPPVSSMTPIITNTNNKDYFTLYTHDFEEVWEAYEKVGVKMTAAKAWSKIPHGIRKEVLDHIREYIRLHKDVDKMTFLPHLSTYLNQRRWESEMPYSREDMPKKKPNNWENIDW
jgi:hypothetical protein